MLGQNDSKPPTSQAGAVAGEGRRSRRRRELHQSILATAAELFARDGFEATTVETIAAAADIAPATFFNHFPSKEDVLREVGQDVFTRFHRLVEEQLERPVPTVERLSGFASRSGQLVRRAPEMTRRVLTAVLRTSKPGEAGDELASMQADFVRLLEHGLGQDQRHNGDDVRADLDIELTAEILVSVVMGSMTHWINDPAYPLEQKMSSALTLLGERLLAPEPSASPRSSRPNTSSASSTPARPSKRSTTP